MAVGKPEIVTQKRVINLFQRELGYRYLGDWKDREGNSNIEEDLLQEYLQKNGYSTAQINRAVDLLRREADHHNRTLYGNTKEVYKYLR
jgi:type I restriction enzyme R subunit